MEFSFLAEWNCHRLKPVLLKSARLLGLDRIEFNVKRKQFPVTGVNKFASPAAVLPLAKSSRSDMKIHILIRRKKEIRRTGATHRFGGIAGCLHASRWAYGIREFD